MVDHPHYEPGPLLEACPSPEYLRAAEAIDYRAMILIYLVLEQDRFSEYDAHYFPEPEIPISRLSEPKNYRDGQGPSNLPSFVPNSPVRRMAPNGTKATRN